MALCSTARVRSLPPTQRPPSGTLRSIAADGGAGRIGVASSRRKRLRASVETLFAQRLSPERTRQATWFERQTVGRLEWDTVARLNRWLELLGRIATAVWICLIATILLGLDVRELVEDLVNSGQPLGEVVLLAVIIPTLAFFLLHSTIGFLRWRLQRELWRRDVARAQAAAAELGLPQDE
jgi:hypothetical protein